MPDLPRCGLYRTRSPIGAIAANSLVYFHNHGDPGPGLYLPASWRANRARFESRGHLLGDPENVAALEPLLREGYYRVTEPFHCCDKQCFLFHEGMLLQLGYDRHANTLLFVPEVVESGLAFPERGTLVHPGRARLAALRVSVRDSARDDEDGPLLH